MKQFEIVPTIRTYNAMLRFYTHQSITYLKKPESPVGEAIPVSIDTNYSKITPLKIKEVYLYSKSGYLYNTGSTTHDTEWSFIKSNQL